MEGDSFQHRLIEALKQKQFSEILTLLNNKESSSLIKETAADLVSDVCSTIKQHNEILLESSDIESCRDVLNLLVEKGNPKEVFVELLGAVDSFKEDECFQLLLTPLQKVLIQLSDKRGLYLNWALNALNPHFHTIPLPENRDLENEELLLLDLDPVVQRTAKTIREYINFLEFFVKEVSSESVSKTVISDSNCVTLQKTLLQKQLLTLLDRPLIYHDLHFVPGKPNSSIQSSCKRLLCNLDILSQSYFALQQFKDCDNSQCSEPDFQSDCVSVLAFGNLAYLIFVENFLPNFRPYVYSASFLFEYHVPVIVCMLTKTEYLVLYKGLHLCKALLECVLDFVLPGTVSPFHEFVKLSKGLANVAIYCQIESYRCLSARLFLSFIQKFSWKARHDLLLFLVDEVHHVGLESLIINLYSKFLQKTEKDCSARKYFVGKNLKIFLKKALHLEDDVKTDIMQNYDKILNSLNLILYLILHDSKSTNVTGIYDNIKEIGETYLEPLQQGINISKAHYQLEAKTVNKKPSKGHNVQIAVNVNGDVMNNDYKKEVIKESLLSLDLMQSVLSRVFEVLDKKIV